MKFNYSSLVYNHKMLNIVSMEMKLSNYTIQCYHEIKANVSIVYCISLIFLFPNVLFILQKLNMVE